MWAHKVFFASARRYVTGTTSVARLKLHPELYNGVFTKFGWVLVPKTHCARGWTQSQLNEALEARFGHSADSKLPSFDEIQEAVDSWGATVDLNEKPVVKKKSAAELKHELDLKLFLQQLKQEGRYTGEKKRLRVSRVKRDISNGDVTFTHAWNYFMAKSYPKYKHLPESDARSRIGLEWRLMSMDEKDVYREEYSQLLQLGKDIYHGEIVDRETKMKAVERLNLSKRRSTERKLKKLEESQKKLAGE